MKLYTTGIKFHPGYDLKLVKYSTADSLTSLGINTCFRIIFIEAGSGIATINNKNTSFIAPCCFCLNEQDNIKITSKEKNINSYLFFHPEVINSSFSFENIRQMQSNFSRSDIQDLYWLEPFINKNNNFTGCLTFGPLTGSHFKELLNNIEQELIKQHDNLWPCRSRSYLFELLNLIMKIHSSNRKVQLISINSPDSEIENIIFYLNSNYHHKITISEITNRFNMDRTTLSQKFKKSTGLTIISYINKLRIQIACTFLKDTTLPVNEIMYRVGYEDKTHFSRFFKKYTGESPSTYREKL